MGFSRLKPESMFHRRLLLLGGLVMLGMVAPIAQMSRWTVFHGEGLREQSMSYLSTWRWLPTTRGSILDRKGRVLAVDRPSFDIAVDYRVISGEWAYSQAYRRARRLHRDDWGRMTNAQRRALAEQYEPDFQARLELMWDRFAFMGGVGREELEARKEKVISEVQSLAALVRKNKRAKLEQLALEAGVEVNIKPGELDRPIAEERQAHVLLRQVDDRMAFDFLRQTQDAELEVDEAAAVFPGVSVIDSGTRDYPLDTMTVSVDRRTLPLPIRGEDAATIRVEGVATHVVGWMRSKVYREDNWDEYLRPRSPNLPDGTPDRSIYLEGESVGQTGVERSAEPELRGLRGIQRTKLDTGEVSETPAEPGQDVRLTIDVQLQARVQALLAPELGLTVVQPWHLGPQEGEQATGVPRLGEPLAGSIVVIEISTGDILAMATGPTFSHAMLKLEPEAVFSDRLLMASLNRAISQPYAAGSIVKPLVLCAAINEGKYSPDELIACTGHFYPNQPNMLRCWTEKMFHTTHSIKFGHDLNGKDAIDGSCNIFFYEMGRRLGPRAMVEWFERFGVGMGAEKWRLGLGDEYPGALPRAGRLTTDAAILLGIGQGPIAWTPLHAADAYATLGRAGVRIVPRLRMDAPVRMTDLHLNARGVEQAMAGLAAAVSDNQNGTANHIRVENPATGQLVNEPIFNSTALRGINVWGKSGTADASALMADIDGDGKKEVLRDGDHSWCVFLVGDEGAEGRPKYAVAVVVDYGGSGGRMAGPIANQVVYSLINEGYLTPRGSGTSKDQAMGGGR